MTSIRDRFAAVVTQRVDALYGAVATITPMTRSGGGRPIVDAARTPIVGVSVVDISDEVTPVLAQRDASKPSGSQHRAVLKTFRVARSALDWDLCVDDRITIGEAIYRVADVPFDDGHGRVRFPVNAITP